MVDKLSKVIFTNDFLGNVTDFDLDILGSFHWCGQVKILDIKACKFCTFAREHTVDHEFDKLKGGRVGPCISWVADAIATDGDTCPIGIFLLGADLTHNRSVGDFFASVFRYVIILDGKEGVRAGNSCPLMVSSDWGQY